MIYLDNSATTKPYPEVIESFARTAGEYFGNPSSLHGIGAKAEILLQQARKQIAELLHTAPSEICFTSGGTEGNNLAVKGAARAAANRGRHIITTKIEHPSVLEACRALEKDGFEVDYLHADEAGRISIQELENLLREDTVLVSIMHVNNETGAVQPVEEAGMLLRRFPRTLFHVDYVQGAGKVPLDFKTCGIDLCTMSGHKFHGLKGTGILYIRSGVQLDPLLTGGNQESRRRSGTENVAGIVAMAKALRMTLDRQNQDDGMMEKVHQLLYSSLEQMEGVLVNSPEDGAPHIINFSVPGIKSEVFIHALEAAGVYCSTTSACSSKNKSLSEPVLAMTGNRERAESVIRISTSYETTLEEAEAAVQAIRNNMAKLQKVMR